MGLTRARNARISGTVRFDGKDLLGASEDDLRKIRGDDIAMIFQDPLSSLHPFYKVGTQIAEGVRAHRDVSKAQAWDRAVEMLSLVGIPEPRKRADAYPHEFSGGMRQRAMIAMALANDPKLLIADEPTTALDVTVQAQILELIERCRASSTPRSSSSPTTSASWPRWPTRSRSCTPAGSSRRPTRTRSSRRPSTPTRGACCPRSRGWTRRAARSWCRSPAARRR